MFPLAPGLRIGKDEEVCATGIRRSRGMALNLKQLRYLVALARHRHFGKAAAECGITQSALSQAIRQLESDFNALIIDRHNHGFEGFTPQGAMVLDFARRTLDHHEHLVQDIGSAGDELNGHVRLGVIPVAMPAISIITTAFNRLYPDVSVSVTSLNFTDLKSGLENFDLDIGINYLDHGASAGLRPYFLYDESYFLIAPADSSIAQRKSVSWTEAGRLPLCMLTPDMQNRRILDRVFASVGVTPRTVLETNCALALCSHVRPGHWFAVVPNTFFMMVGDWSQTRAVPLIEPSITNTIGLMVLERDPQPPAVSAFIEVAEDIRMARELMRYAPAHLKCEQADHGAGATADTPIMHSRLTRAAS
ncbi:DNA-binding transcriptional LysR family regulator [Methylorubrum rhodesianum]|uniref:LysR family transcriptional regulator n=2 Tax=Methylorubrum TaxID=2282523 RepID=UPI00180B1F00|nr:LysR family transcriptional regulator [Methylorubrum rhodesianum]MBB5765596.1 DNA-binding transcriptional LysR family regulator [Methylorubrum rhodesianum]